MRKLQAPLLALAAACGALGAAPALAANLGALVDLARAGDAQYAAARAAADAGRERRVQGRAGLLPAVNLSGNQRRNHDYSSAYAGPGDYTSSNWALTVNQPLLRKANLEAYAQGELQSLLAEQQLKLAEQELLLRVAKGYFDVLQAQDALAAVGAQKQAFAQQLAQAKRSYEVGLAPITDVNEAQSRYDLTLAQEIAAANDLEVKRRVLEKSISAPLPPLALLDPAAGIDILGAEQAGNLAERAAEEALPVAIGRTAEQVARRELGKQAAGHLPTLDLVLSVGEARNANYGAFGGTNTHQSSVGVELALPLYQGGAVGSREREAAANLQRARHELANAQQQARLDARQAMLGVQSGSALHRALQQALQSSELQVKTTQRGFEVGVRNRVDVLNAEQQLYATRKDLAAARYQTLLAGLQLKAAAGQLTEQDLRAIDALLKE